jgi:hypothetical protein
VARSKQCLEAAGESGPFAWWWPSASGLDSRALAPAGRPPEEAARLIVEALQAAVADLGRKAS